LNSPKDYARLGEHGVPVHNLWHFHTLGGTEQWRHKLFHPCPQTSEMTSQDLGPNWPQLAFARVWFSNGWSKLYCTWWSSELYVTTHADVNVDFMIKEISDCLL
jgi:hypothetical protein